ncbi:MAG: peroxiredoxin family protein [Planctomycetota bacterium]|nr:peroxiredoxin family protein [Planctomycetota bacterium]
MGIVIRKLFFAALLFSSVACTVPINFSFSGDKPSNLKETEAKQTVGEKLPVPETDLLSSTGEKISLKKYEGKSVVLVFMRGFSGYVCPYCATYTAQLSLKYEEFKKRNAEVLVVYPTKADHKAKVEQFINACNERLEAEGKTPLSLPVFLDPGLKLVTQYNLLGDLSRPSTFVLDGQGVVRYGYVGADKADRPGIDRVLQEIEKINGSSKK